MMALALTGKIAPYKSGFGPFSADVFHATFPDAYRDGTVADSIQSIERIFIIYTGILPGLVSCRGQAYRLFRFMWPVSGPMRGRLGC